ncbi:MAG: hypothetical protein AB7T06_39915 [Kofleriaceae bacterium]
MRNAGLIAFGVTTCVLVPAAVHRLSAGKEQIAKLAAPSQDELELRGAKVKVALDKYMLDPGEPLTISIAATEAKGKVLEVGVLVLASNGSEGDRVETPPNGIAFRIVKLPVKDGVATGETTIALKGANGQNAWRPFGHYEVLVGEPNAIEKLESLRRRTKLIGDEEMGIPSLNKAGSTFMGLYRGWSDDEAAKSAYAEGRLARLDAHTRPKSSAIALTTPETARAGTAFAVGVTVKNPGKRAMKGLEVSLVEHQGLDDNYGEPTTAHLAFDTGKIAIDLAPHETRTVQFQVTPDRVGVFGLYAQATCAGNYDEESACKDVQALQLGAFDAVEILPADEKAPAVVVR